MRQLMLFFLGISWMVNQVNAQTTEIETPFFRASQKQPYHLSVGAVLFNDEGQIACHYFEEIFGLKDIYILMRETVENGETITATLHRGLLEEFGATAEPMTFLGSLSGFVKEPQLRFEKTTLYIVCKLKEWDINQRDVNDPEGQSMIKWKNPQELIALMQLQGQRFQREDADESEMIKRALSYIEN